MSDQRFPWELANCVAADIVNRLQSGCVRIEVAGSLRRHKDDVGDIEILYIPFEREETDPSDMFGTKLVNFAERDIRLLIGDGILELRKNVLGRATYGPLNKLMRHVASGIPVDLFAADAGNWFNYLVCRTGPAELNVQIASAAKRKGWQWNPYGRGFTRGAGVHTIDSERAIFEFVGIPYADPEKRL